MAYYQFQNENGEGFGSCEIYFMSFNNAIEWGIVEPDGDGGWYVNNGYEKYSVEPEDVVGWYWQAGFPGSYSDGEPMGPFATEEEAMNDANVIA